MLRFTLSCTKEIKDYFWTSYRCMGGVIMARLHQRPDATNVKNLVATRYSSAKMYVSTHLTTANLLL